MPLSAPHQVAKELGREDELIVHYEAVIDRMSNEAEARVRRAVESIERDHERTVATLNATIAKLNGEASK